MARDLNSEPATKPFRHYTVAGIFLLLLLVVAFVVAWAIVQDNAVQREETLLTSIAFFVLAAGVLYILFTLPGSLRRIQEESFALHLREAITSKAPSPTVVAAPEAPTQTAVEPSTPMIYEGKNYDLIEVEGIGETYAKRLEAIGVRTTDDLLGSDPANVAEAAEASLPVVEKWRGMAELMRVKGIGKQFSELLVRSGVTSIDELKEQKPERLLRRVEQTQAEVGVTIQGAKLNTTRVGDWIREAKRMKRRPIA